MSIVPSAAAPPAIHNSASSTSSLSQTANPTCLNVNQSTSNTTTNTISSSNKDDPQQQFSNLSVTGLSSMKSSSNSSSSPTPSNSLSNLVACKTPPSSGSILSVASTVHSKNNTLSLPATSAETTSASALPVHSPQTQYTPAQPQQPVYDDINIFMWSVCKVCNKSSKKTAMSPDTWSYSLAKFLELTFHGKEYHQFNSDCDSLECRHSLFLDHYQYFRFKNIVTVFSLSKINLKQIHLPIDTLNTMVNKLHI